jgi:MYXO-CTERM domain-containing protein
MPIRARAMARTWLITTALVAGLMAPTVARAAQLTAPSTPVTQTSSLPLTPTDFAAGNNVPGNPLTFNQFDTLNQARVLDSVTLTLHAAIENQFGMKFTTPATITDTIGTASASQPGPTITMYQPDGKTPLLTVGATATDALSRSVTYGSQPGQTLPQEFSSSLPTTSPFYIAPTSFDKTQTLTLTSPADLALFTGNGTLKLPVSAAAWSEFNSSSGNGFGSVTTAGKADVTVTYNWHDRIPAPQTVPEPASIAVWSLAGLGLAATLRARRRNG